MPGRIVRIDAGSDDRDRGAPGRKGRFVGDGIDAVCSAGDDGPPVRRETAHERFGYAPSVRRMFSRPYDRYRTPAVGKFSPEIQEERSARKAREPFGVFGVEPGNDPNVPRREHGLEPYRIDRPEGVGNLRDSVGAKPGRTQDSESVVGRLLPDFRETGGKIRQFRMGRAGSVKERERTVAHANGGENENKGRSKSFRNTDEPALSRKWFDTDLPHRGNFRRFERRPFPKAGPWSRLPRKEPFERRIRIESRGDRKGGDSAIERSRFGFRIRFGTTERSRGKERSVPISERRDVGYRGFRFERAPNVEKERVGTSERSAEFRRKFENPVGNEYDDGLRPNTESELGNGKGFGKSGLGIFEEGRKGSAERRDGRKAPARRQSEDGRIGKSHGGERVARTPGARRDEIERRKSRIHRSESGSPVPHRGGHVEHEPDGNLAVGHVRPFQYLGRTEARFPVDASGIPSSVFPKAREFHAVPRKQ